ncbi:MAG TPA: hypothetical protein VG144_03525 [Gaiellaceae bacterium]|jgi:hypothetical protein|nr:hypothetical protein [Gaiellaceae bacterium]
MNRTEEARIARTESVFRHVNERIAETVEHFAMDETLFVCECADPGCHHRVEVPLETYEEVRENPTRFIVAEGHEEPGFERVVAKRRGFAVIEKITHRLRTMVRQSDPRTSAT